VDRITAHTKGCIIYQEQILQIVREVGGFDWTNANEIRRIIAKKIGQAAFQVSMGNFQDGAMRLHGIDKATSERIWKRIVTSGTYAFVYAHSVSYSMLGWWCAWLKVHYPAEFYAASLSKAGDERAAFRLMKDAEKHGHKILAPQLNVSTRRWNASGDGQFIVAGWQTIPGLGEVMANKIETYRAEHGDFTDWDDLQAIPGIGPKSVANWEAFCSSHDPFKLGHARRVLTRVRSAIESHKVDLPKPTHTGDELAALDDKSGGTVAKPGTAVARRGARQGGGKWNSDSTLVVYIGIVRERAYQNAAENERSRTGDDMDVILKRMKAPDKQDYCILRCYDDGEEDVYVRTTRYSFPKFRRTLEGIAVGHDIVVVRGRKSPGFGTSVFADEIWVIDPEG
jgi:DNA polymerase-3 subunit alpha